MKKPTNFNLRWIIIGILALVAVGIIIFAIIDNNNKAAEFAQIDLYANIDARSDNGEIADHIKGDPNAPVTIVEYANFQCSHCASMNPVLEEAIENSNGGFNIIFRNYPMANFPNSTAAAAAAEAAGLQGYWQTYADKLFAEQAEWFYATADERGQYFNKYFKEVTDGQGDLDQFNRDIASEAVTNKINFDRKLGDKSGVSGTPNFFIDGQQLNFSGGELTINGQTITYEEISDSAGLIDLIEQINAAKSQ